MSESKIQNEFIMWFNKSFPRLRGTCYHIPNGGSRTAIEGAKFKATGVLAGVPDVHIVVPSKTYHSLYIEFKKPGGKCSDAQLREHEILKRFDHCVIVCDSFDKARELTLIYLKDVPLKYIAE